MLQFIICTNRIAIYAISSIFIFIIYLNIHVSIYYSYSRKINCGICEKTCRVDAISTVDGKIVLDKEKCNNCGRCVKACPTDAWKATPAFEVSFGGLFGNRVYKGENYLPLVTSEEQLFRITDAAIQFFDDNANPGERFRMTLERVGLDKFEEKIKEAYNG